MVRIATERRAGFDLLRLPIIGRFLTWRHSRTAMQTVMLLLSAALLFDGFFGPALAPKNVAGVIPWVQWRGFLVLALLVGGNFFCMACPFMLPRKLAKKLLPANRNWPRWLRSKWLAVALLLLFFWSYEAFALWSSPFLTAWVALAYFVSAFVVDGFFKGAAFCKYVCPIGQFNFVNSLVSPLEVQVRSLDVCATCKTKDCIRGRYDTPSKRLPGIELTQVGAEPRRVQSGCELWLFQQRKTGNMDCTFCLDCVHACPYDNVGVMGRKPLSDLWRDGFRSGVGKFERRLDLAALVLLLVFGAFMNAFAMIAPVYELEAWISAALGTQSKLVVLSVLFGFGLVVLPALIVYGTARLHGSLTEGKESALSLATRFSYTLVPLGFGMWLAHYGFHFLTGALTFIPVTQSFLVDLGLSFLGAPRWDLGPVVPASWLVPVEGIFLELGLIGTLITTYKLATRTHGNHTARWRAFTPWAGLACLLFVFGMWVMMQPMQMRGTFLGGG